MPISYSVEGGVAVIALDNPGRKNAIALSMRREIRDAFEKAQDDSDVRAIVLTGVAGDFSAGADVKEMGVGGVPPSLYRMRELHRMARAIAATAKPVIAAVSGVCVGMAWAMALACDVVVAAEDARFQFAFRHIGLAPDCGAAFLLTRYVGLQRAKEILYSGRFVSGTEACQLGLALHALPTAEVLPKAMELAHAFAESPTLAIAMAKRQLDAASAQTYEQALDFEANIQPLMVVTDDFKEGTDAFKEKRKPAYKGS